MTPLWGQRIKRQKGGAALYYELSPVGHCPHHEAPRAVNTLVSEWIAAVERGVSLDEERVLRERVFEEEVTGERVRATLQSGQPRDTVEWLAASLMG